MRYVKNVFLNEARSYDELNISDFDVDSYIKDLEFFFDDYNNRFSDDEEVEDLD
ncbi:MAG: hypothetical protein ACTHJ0_16340 [Flavipsychrobacter sp.]